MVGYPEELILYIDYDSLRASTPGIDSWITSTGKDSWGQLVTIGNDILSVFLRYLG